MTHSDVATKVRKLLALADQSRNNSEAEAAAALNKAMELIERFDLQPDEYGESHAEAVEYRRSDYAVSIIHVSRTLRTWRKWLASAAAEATGCKVVVIGLPSYLVYDNGDEDARLQAISFDLSGHRAITIMGRPEDRACCRALFNYLERTCDRLAKAHIRKGRGAARRNGMAAMFDGRIEGNAYRASYACGVLAQVETKRREQRGERSPSALMVLERDEENLERAQDDIFPNLQRGRAARYRHNQTAYSQGSRAHLGRNTVGGGNGSIGLPGGE